MAKPPVIVVGSSNTDMIIQLDRIPKPGETILGGRFTTAAGGKGANQAVAAARAGGAVTFIARLGRDMLGDQAVAGFAADRIRTQFIVRDRRSPSGVALIFVDARGENSIAVAPGANGNLTPADVRRAKAAFTAGGILVLQLETPLRAAQAAAEHAVAVDMRVILNPAPARALPNTLLRQLYLLTPNESEAELLTGIAVSDTASARQAAGVLRQRGVRNVIVTLGARGALVDGADGAGWIPAFKVKPVDSTAAGDVFNGALAVGLAEGRSLLDAARFGAAAAAISVTRLGAQTSAPARQEIERLLALAGRRSRPDNHRAA
ncbi:MAG TPA: ribokinase [Verrucomicrobiota bacterium]|nr:ribokinase [Verrucomicrobiota bacterium]HNT15447.1 ribokinase [Verrucomicrobiota bacterium]